MLTCDKPLSLSTSNRQLQCFIFVYLRQTEIEDYHCLPKTDIDRAQYMSIPPSSQKNHEKKQHNQIRKTSKPTNNKEKKKNNFKLDKDDILSLSILDRQ